MSALSPPTLRVERSLLRAGYRVVAGVDEVGRGALAGPVTVGIVVVSSPLRPAPVGVADSKTLTDRGRRAVAPRIRHWALASAIGHAQAWEVDDIGLMGALRVAVRRALSSLARTPDVIVLDGGFDFTDQDIPVQLQVRGDARCSTVAAASVLAKVARDDVMTHVATEFPSYGWERNKGYGTSAHLGALRAHGVSPHHRRSWRLPSTGVVATD